jgi:CMP-N,N'-diacetyllegionaminic acid synthase
MVHVDRIVSGFAVWRTLEPPMIDSRTVLGLIPARGGSRGLPRKNVLPLGGKPLLHWSIDAARESRYIDQVVVSSDDQEIIDLALSRDCEAPFRRPDELATSTTPTLAVAMHAIRELPEFDILVLLQPTSPLRLGGDIDATLEALVGNRASSAVSVCESAKSPHWMYHLGDDQSLTPVLDADPPATRRQDLPPVYCLNGAVYAVEVPWLVSTGAFVGANSVAYVMPARRSIDIDTAADMRLAEFLMQEDNHE